VGTGCDTRLVWQNEVGVLTFEVRSPDGRRFLKWAPAPSGIDLGDEVTRLAWAADLWSVPRVICSCSDAGRWMLTAALPDEHAVSDRWRADPDAAVRAIREGLRAPHEALPVAACPCSWSWNDRLADARHRADAGLLDPKIWHDTRRSLDIDTALALAANAPEVDRLAVCYGDACAPNTLIGDDGHWTGHVDLGSLGVADRWADLAVVTWSTEWNYGPGWETPLLDVGIGPDPQRSDYYRLLWDLGP
jgi:aminoglycoside phosphotransferase